MENITDLRLIEDLKDKGFRSQFFRAELELSIPSQLKTLRKKRQLNQTQLAQLLGTQQSAISRIERSDEMNLELETLLRLADALDARLSVKMEPAEDVIYEYATSTVRLNNPVSSIADVSVASWQNGNEVQPTPTRKIGEIDERHIDRTWEGYLSIDRNQASGSSLSARAHI